ncbi:MAG: hypothetical protein AB7L09_02355 [Nitrospira sp.]
MSHTEIRRKFTAGTRVRWAAYPGFKWRAGTIREWTCSNYVIIDWDGVDQPDRRNINWLEEMVAMDVLDELASI